MSSASFRIAHIPAEMTYDLRARVLRPGLSFQESRFDCDTRPETFHLGAFQSNSESPLVLGVASFFPEVHPELPKTDHPFRLRGMAVDPAWRRRHIGQTLLQAGEADLARLHCDLLWFNAREVAFPFYRSCGYVEQGELFEIPGIGPHKVMMKRF